MHCFTGHADYWQGVAGGGEGDESPEEAARRELSEEAGVGRDVPLLALDSRASVTVVAVTGGLTFGPDVLMIPEYAFGASCRSRDLQLSQEHRECRWFPYEDACRFLRWDSNRSALWELDFRLRRMRTPS